MGATHELAAYLGENSFESHKLVWTAERLAKILTSHASWADFQNDVESLYLYARREDSDEWWLPHLAFASEQLAPHTRSVMAYGAATGCTGFPLIQRGFDVSFAARETRCSDFLQWRLKSRKEKKAISPLDAFPISRLYGGVVCFDMLGQYDEDGQKELLDLLPSIGSIAIFDADVRDRPGMKGVDVDALLKWLAERHEVVTHKVANHYVHLVAYRGAEHPVEIDLEG